MCVRIRRMTEGVWLASLPPQAAHWTVFTRQNPLLPKPPPVYVQSFQQVHTHTQLSLYIISDLCIYSYNNMLLHFNNSSVTDLIARVKKISTARSSGDTPLHKCSRTGKYVSNSLQTVLTVENPLDKICYLFHLL